MQLYSVTTVVKQFQACADVSIHWFLTEPTATDRPYAELITDYDAQDEGYARDAIDELFTATEAAELVAYLERVYGGDGVTTTAAVALPIGQNTMGVGAIPVGGSDDFYMLTNAPGYSLPFKVWGYYDLSECRRLDGTGVYRPRLWILGPDGGMRQQTGDGDGGAGVRRVRLRSERGGDMHLHERIAQRITEMSNDGQVSPEAVRCLLSEFPSATLHDWGAAHCMVPFPPKPVAHKGADASCTVIDEVIDTAEQLTFWTPRQTLELLEEAVEWQRSRVLQRTTIECLRARPDCVLPVGGAEPADEIAWYRTLDDRVYEVVVDHDHYGSDVAYGWTLYLRQGEAMAVANVAGALSSYEAAINSLHTAMLRYQAGEAPCPQILETTRQRVIARVCRGRARCRALYPGHQNILRARWRLYPVTG